MDDKEDIRLVREVMESDMDINTKVLIIKRILATKEYVYPYYPYNYTLGTGNTGIDVNLTTT
jgi:hypothetical protein